MCEMNSLERLGVNKYFESTQRERRKVFYLINLDELLRKYEEFDPTKSYERLVKHLSSDVLKECGNKRIKCDNSDISFKFINGSEGNIRNLRSMLERSIESFDLNLNAIKYVEENDADELFWGVLLVGIVGASSLGIYYNNPNLFILGMGASSLTGALITVYENYKTEDRKNKLNKLKKLYEIMKKSLTNDLST